MTPSAISITAPVRKIAGSVILSAGDVYSLTCPDVFLAGGVIFSTGGVNAADR